MKNKPYEFIKGYEVYDVPPMSHYFEEIYPNLYGIKKLGVRGDKNYVWHSIKQLGTAYYEQHEMELSAKSAYSYFQNIRNRQKFLRSVNRVLEEAANWRNIVEKLDLSTLPDRKIALLLLKTQKLEASLFSHYIVSQPYRMKLLEDTVRKELKKVVAASRIDHYLSLLTESTATTKVSKENIEWLKLLLKHKAKTEDSDNSELQRDISNHFEKYKTLSLGDGNWSYDIGYFTDRLKVDLKQPLSILKKQYEDAISRPKHIETQQSTLGKSLNLSPEIKAINAFLADIGDTRFSLRTDGFIPNIKTKISINIELTKRLGYTSETPLIEYMTVKELGALIRKWKIVPESVLTERVGANNEYLLVINKGRSNIYYSNEAHNLFKKLVPTKDLSVVTQLEGTAAVSGKIKGKVTVFNWGDNMELSMQDIKKYPILVAGQTRPAMMPLIRLAKGIITDEGGVTSHAAIVSRELGIPSVIGTIHATKTFKTGDTVELDAQEGVVRKLQ